jgi:hypothetical protein
MATTPVPTPATPATPAAAAPQQFLQPYESDILRTLLIDRQQANDNVKSYLLQILGVRNLDPNKYGVSPDLRSFTEIQAPVAAEATPATDAPAAPAAA